MKLYYDPISTTSRPVVMFALDHGVQFDLEHIDLMSRQQFDPAYRAVNPNTVVPFLVDGDFQLGESSAILKYLADKLGSPAYPTELKARATVNAAMDWFATNLHKDFCGMVCYTQLGLFADMDPAAVRAMVVYGEQKSPRWLAVLDQTMIGARPYVCGEDITLADYLGAAYISLGELVAFDFTPYPNIRRWLANMRAQPGWNVAYAAFNGWLSAARAQAPATA